MVSTLLILIDTCMLSLDFSFSRIRFWKAITCRAFTGLFQTESKHVSMSLNLIGCWYTVDKNVFVLRNTSCLKGAREMGEMTYLAPDKTLQGLGGWGEFWL